MTLLTVGGGEQGSAGYNLSLGFADRRDGCANARTLERFDSVPCRYTTHLKLLAVRICFRQEVRHIRIGSDAIGQHINQTSRALLQVPQGSLYPSLHRLEERGWVSSTWQLSENNRRAKVYTLTQAGRLQLRAEQREWGNFVSAVSKVLDATALPA